MSRTKKIILISLGFIYFIHGAYMLGAYFNIDSLVYIDWDVDRAIAIWYKRSFAEFLFLLIFSFMCLWLALKKNHYKAVLRFFLICIGLFSFFLSGQNVKVYVLEPGIEVCFGTIPFRTLYYPSFQKKQILNIYWPEYEFKENFFSFYIKVKNDPAKKEGAYILSGIGPILRLKNR
jgi:hypothetical protein